MQNEAHLVSQQRVYLDFNATTPPLSALRSRWSEVLEISGNPSSIHNEGRVPKTILREARNKISGLLGCSPLEVIFNSGASEGNSSILRSVHDGNRSRRNEYLISQVEHPSVLKTAAYLVSQGAVVHFIPVSQSGVIDMNFIRDKLSSRTALVSVMYANNETGNIFPVKEIAQVAHAAGALMHADCVQLLGKSDVDFSCLELDYATFSAHKLYSIKGTGFCYVKKGSPWSSLIHGGQERGRRGGTENVTGIAALNIVLDSFNNCKTKINAVEKLRNEMETNILAKIPAVRIVGKAGQRISNTSSLVIDNIDGETLLMTLDLKGFAVSTGAACSSGNSEPSPVLMAMGLSREQAQSSLRISLGWESDEQQINRFVSTLADTVTKLREINLEEKKRSHAI